MTNLKKLLEKTGYTIRVNDDVLAAIPRSTEKKMVEVFTVGKYVTDKELEKEYESRGLVPADFDSVLSVEKKYDHIATHWKDAGREWCFLTFYWWDDERYVYCSRSDDVWDDDWFFAGVRKSSALKISALPSDTLSLESRVISLEAVVAAPSDLREKIIGNGK